MRPCGLSSATTAAGCAAQSGCRLSISWSGNAGRLTQASRSGVEFFMAPGGPPAFVLQYLKTAGKPITRVAPPLRMSTERDERTERIIPAFFVRQAKQCRMVSMRKCREPRLEWHRNVGASKIEHH